MTRNFKEQVTGNKSKGNMLISMCFEARTTAHKLHLQTNSYSTHVALNTFYDEIISLVDSYAEGYQGRYGIIQTYPEVSLAGNPISMIQELRKWIDLNRKFCGDYSELQNEIDNIVTLCNSTLYKLENLG